MSKSTLKKEIDATLQFFVDTDISMFGKIQQSTLNCFKAQNVELPEKYKRFL